MLAAATAAGLLGGWALLENTAPLRVQHYAVPLSGLPRTAVIADLHKRQFGEENRRLIAKVGAAHPELILIPGDLISRTERDLAKTARLLHALREIAPVIAAAGNHEVDLPPELYAAYRRITAECGVTLLENSCVTVGGICYAGLWLPRSYYRGGGLLGFRGKHACTAETLTKLLGTPAEKTVLLAHNPLFFPAYAEWGAALTVSGHVHGGAVRLPLLGGLLSPERTFFPPFSKGYYTDGTHGMIVSGGLGKLRFGNPPEIVILTAQDCP